MHQEALMQTALETYTLPENREFYITASKLEALGYCQWPRLCRGLRQEAKVVDSLLRRAGLDVVSVICKTGGIDKEHCGISPEGKVHPGDFGPMCNPNAQAMLLNQQKTQFNIALGLCVGHGSMFYKYFDALVTNLVTKSWGTGHKPAAAIYCAEGYFKDRLWQTKRDILSNVSFFA